MLIRLIDSPEGTFTDVPLAGSTIQVIQHKDSDRYAVAISNAAGDVWVIGGTGWDNKEAAARVARMLAVRANHPSETIGNKYEP